MGQHIPELGTEVNRLTYDYTARVGVLYLPDHCCTDMTGAVALFERIDPEVIEIQTFAGDQRDTFYSRRSGDPDTGLVRPNGVRWWARRP